MLVTQIAIHCFNWVGLFVLQQLTAYSLFIQTRSPPTKMNPSTSLLKQVPVLFVLLLSSHLVTSSFHFWKGTFLYISEYKMTLEEAMKFCAEIGGVLPSVHSSEELTLTKGYYPVRIYGIWLGAKPKFQNENYEWIDGTPFDYSDFGEDESCGSSCCGVSVNYYFKMKQVPCDNSLYAACLLKSLNTKAMNDWLKTHNNTMGLLNGTIEDTRQVKQSVNQLDTVRLELVKKQNDTSRLLEKKISELQEVNQSVHRIDAYESRLPRWEPETPADPTWWDLLIFVISAFFVVTAIIAVHRNFQKVTGALGSIGSKMGSISFRRFT